MSKIKASTLLRNVELASLGAILDEITDEVERLEELDCECEWGIYFPEDDFWAGKSETVSHVRTTSFDEIIRFQSRTDAMRFKSERHLYLSAIPFPVPKLREA